MKPLSVLMIALIAGGAVFALALFINQPRPEREIVGGLESNDSLPVVFEKATNLTDNEQDSVYGQVAAWNSSVYVIWQDSVSGMNYDIFIQKSNDNGTSFGPPFNLSNNSGFSEHPQLSAYGSNVYAVWVDNTTGNRQVFFARSSDNGISFENTVTLSNNTLDSHNEEMAAFADNVYVVWADRYEHEDTSIFLRASADGGATFNRTIKISSLANADSFPKVAAYGDRVYVTWNVIGDGTNGGLYFAKSSDGGSTFGNATKLDDSAGESQVAAYNNTVYVVSGGLDFGFMNGMLFLKSTDGGETFAEPALINPGGKFVNPMNLDVVASDHEVAYVAGQVFVLANEEILLLAISDNNATEVINLSKNEKISECPSIAMTADNIHVVWEDLTPGNHEVLYAKGSKT